MATNAVMSDPYDEVYVLALVKEALASIRKEA